MNIKKYNVCTILIAILMAVGIASCSTDDGYTQGSAQEQFQKIFENMKGSYAGTLTLPDNSSMTVKYDIDNEAKVNISSFPMDRILFKVYQSDYLKVKMGAEAVSYSCPIDSVGLSGGYLTFVTKRDYTSNTIHFSFTKDEQQHSGYAYVTVKGYYDYTRNWMNINFIVTDLIIDQKDYTKELCPLNHQFEANRQ